MLNRAALIVRPQAPFLAWIKGVENDGPVPPLTGATVYLIPEVEDDAGLEELLSEIWPEIFERELEGWYTDETLWPRQRTYALFKQWCAVEVHSVIEDLCGYPLEDDELEEDDELD